MSPFETRDGAESARRVAEERLRGYDWPAPLRSVLQRLQEGGEQAHVVGGPVRDVLLGRPLDVAWDVATTLTPDEVRARFSRIVGIGESHGTVLILEGALQVECTTFRTEGTYTDARRPDAVHFTRDAIADLARRDLTVNAMAFDPESGVLLDPFGGALDLEARVLRAVGEPLDRLSEDALRALRVARFAAVLEMEVEPRTRAAMAQVVERARLLAVERVRVEFEKMLTAPRPSRGLELLREAGLLALWLPELASAHGVTQNRYHVHDVYWHSLHACDAAPADHPQVRWAALLHDIGKPATRALRPDGQATFYNHERVGAEMVDRMLERLRFATLAREHVVQLVRDHMFDYQPEWSDAAVRRFIRRVGRENIADLFALRVADKRGSGVPSSEIANLEAFSARIQQQISHGAGAFSVVDLAVDGGTVMRVLGLGPGPAVGRVLETMLEAVIEDPSRNTPEGLTALLRGLKDASPGA